MAEATIFEHTGSSARAGIIPKNSPQIAPPALVAKRSGKEAYSSNSTSEFLAFPSGLGCSSSSLSTVHSFIKLAKDQSTSSGPLHFGETALFEHTINGGPHPHVRGGIQPRKLASWFSGSSEPVNLRLIPSPAKGKHELFCEATEMERGSKSRFTSREVKSTSVRPKSTTQNSKSSLPIPDIDPAASGKFAFWRPRLGKNPQRSEVAEDEFAGLDIRVAPLTSGTMDNLSPENFKEFHSQAEDKIHRLRDAYQKALQSVREVISEKNVLMDELYAAQTRGEQLKLQIASLARQSNEQESAMLAMREELATLRHQIKEDAEFRGRSLRLVTTEPSEICDIRRMPSSIPMRKRYSAESLTSDDSSSESVFSQAPLGTCTPISAPDTSPERYQAPGFEDMEVEPVKECQTCHGVTRSEAWDVVHMLKEESKALKARILQYERANEDALNFLGVVSGGVTA